MINSAGPPGKADLHQAVRTAVINKRAGGMGLISGRKAFQKPMAEGGAAPQCHPGRRSVAGGDDGLTRRPRSPVPIRVPDGRQGLAGQPVAELDEFPGAVKLVDAAGIPRDLDDRVWGVGSELHRRDRVLHGLE